MDAHQGSHPALADNPNKMARIHKRERGAMIETPMGWLLITVADSTMTRDEMFEKWIALAWPGLKPTSDRYGLAKKAFMVGRLSVTNPEELVAGFASELQRRRDIP